MGRRPQGDDRCKKHKMVDHIHIGLRPRQILYGVPLPPSQAQRLGHLGKMCGHAGIGGLSVLIDHIDQLDSVQIVRAAPVRPSKSEREPRSALRMSYRVTPRWARFTNR